MRYIRVPTFSQKISRIFYVDDVALNPRGFKIVKGLSPSGGMYCVWLRAFRFRWCKAIPHGELSLAKRKMATIKFIWQRKTMRRTYVFLSFWAKQPIFDVSDAVEPLPSSFFLELQISILRERSEFLLIYRWLIWIDGVHQLASTPLTLKFHATT